MKVKTYGVSLDIDYAALTYTGKVSISLEDVKSDVTLNSVDLNIERASAGGKPITWEKGKDPEELVFKGVPEGSPTLDIDYSGKVAVEMLSGLYKSRFDGGYILTTQFESTQARRMIPCIDHPAYKAVFNFDLTVPSGLGVIFNTEPREVTDLGNGKKKMHFHPTPRMSTYLLYLGIGNFHEIERKSGKLRVIVALPEDRKDSAGFALDHGAPTVEFFEKYFGISYPLPKLHFISVPDCWMGAMENWGAISFREIALLVDDNSSATLKRQVAMVIAHEVAHQWFGDLVTMSWWNDIWLNESFATFMSYQAVDHLHPDWKVWNDFLSEDLTRAYLWDALLTSHPIEANVERPVDIDEAFDEISYEKGGAVIRMIEAFLGKEGFREGVSAYLKKFEYGNATSLDLWRCIEEVTGIPVPTIMGAWVNRIGYPLVTAREEGTKIHLHQDRFLLEGHGDADPWPLPIVMDVDGKEHHFLMDRRDQVVDIGHENPNVIVNQGRTGYYRVAYGPKLHSRLMKRLKDLPDVDRWGMVQDTYAFLLADKAGIKEYLELVKEAENDSSSLVTSEIAMELGNLISLTEDLPEVREAMRSFTAAQMDRIGLSTRPGESQTDKSLREKLAMLRVYLDSDFARDLSAKYSDYEHLDPELKVSVAAAYALTGGKKEHEVLSKAFLDSVSETETWRMSVALCSFRQRELMEATSELVFKEETGLGRAITLVGSFITLASRTNVGREVLWLWIQQNMDKMLKFTQGSAIFSHFMQAYISKGGIGREEEIRKYMASKELPGGESGKAKGLELLKVYSRLYKRFRQA